MKKEYWLITVWALIMLVLLILFAIIANSDSGKEAKLEAPQNSELPPPGIPEMPLESENSVAPTSQNTPSDAEIDRYFRELSSAEDKSVGQESGKGAPVGEVKMPKVNPIVKEAAGGWVQFKSISEGFEAEFPETPKDSYGKMYQGSVDAEVEYHDFVAVDPNDETIYMVIIRNYPASSLKSGINLHLESVLKGILASSAQNKLISSRLTNYRTYPAIEFHMEMNGLHSRGVIAMINGRMVQLSTSYKEGVNAEKGYERFLVSFKVL